MKHQPYLQTDAIFSECGLYRYSLTRRLSMGERTVLFVGLNPSTADASIDDPTIRRCIGYARLWGYDWFFMGNLNGYRSTDPDALPLDGLTAVGPGNQDALRWMAQRADLIVAAWGAHPLSEYARTLGTIILGNTKTRCFGANADGTPKHPLYLKKDRALVAVPSLP